MRHDRSLTAGKYGGEHVAAPSDGAMPNRVDATKNRMQPSATYESVDRPFSHSKRA